LVDNLLFGLLNFGAGGFIEFVQILFSEAGKLGVRERRMSGPQAEPFNSFPLTMAI
jgi:hypothetical protein